MMKSPKFILAIVVHVQDHIPIGVLENGIASPDGLGLEMSMVKLQMFVVDSLGG